MGPCGLRGLYFVVLLYGQLENILRCGDATGHVLHGCHNAFHLPGEGFFSGSHSSVKFTEGSIPLPGQTRKGMNPWTSSLGSAIPGMGPRLADI